MKIGQKISGLIARLAQKTRLANVATLRGAALFARLFTQPARNERLRINKLDLAVKAYHLNGKAVAELGIDPRSLRGGAELYVLSKDDYQRYCQTIDADPEVLAGVYAPAGKKEIYQLMQGAQPMLSRDPGPRRRQRADPVPRDPARLFPEPEPVGGGQGEDRIFPARDLPGISGSGCPSRGRYDDFF
jgi:hypothetical protein